MKKKTLPSLNFCLQAMLDLIIIGVRSFHFKCVPALVGFKRQLQAPCCPSSVLTVRRDEKQTRSFGTSLTIYSQPDIQKTSPKFEFNTQIGRHISSTYENRIPSSVKGAVRQKNQQHKLFLGY
jgi:hypothetical protein